jgi:NosR/NirI family transcriptional regulator, nitrous oxide reductase regulator
MRGWSPTLVLTGLAVPFRFVALIALTLLALLPSAVAQTLSREDLAKLFPAPMSIGERDANFPVFPLFNGGAGEANLAGWIFETGELAPIPGFSGTPPNMLVSLAPDGTFLDVRILSHHEPVFLDGLGPEPLVRFLEQYRGKQLGKSIKVGSNINSAEKASSSAQYIDGVAKATASVLIMNQSILSSAIKVARAKLGYAGSSASANPAKPDVERFEKRTWQGLIEAGLVVPLSLSNADAEKAFAGTIAEGLDEEALAKPDDDLFKLYAADPLVPTVGRNLLGDAAYNKLVADLPDGQSTVLVISAGRWSAMGEDWTPGSVPDRLAVKQSGLPIVVRDMAFSKTLPLKDVPSQEVMILKIPAQAGFDPASPFDIVPHITRKKGIIYPDLVSVDVPKPVNWPQAYYVRSAAAEESAEGWRTIWQARAADLLIIAVSLALLTLALIFQRQLTRHAGFFTAFRLAFLAFTLGFIGWYAQAQLSIVTLIGVVKAAVTTQDFVFLLWDPPSLLLWVFTLGTFVVWGRGAFCGWLCPFGALQELFAEISRRLRIKQWRIAPELDVHLRKLKYVSLAVIIAAAASQSAMAEKLAEVEPFKTSITLYFVRSAPFVIYALVLLGLNLFVYKAFCRYLCPLGALMAIGGKLRILDWIPRRAACGSPCQLCKVKCRYGAIEKSGAIQYDECFQCLDCVKIYFDPKECVPLVLATKRPQVELAGVPA